MDLKKRKHFTPKKGDNFLMSLFFCLTEKQLALVKSYNAAVQRLFKTFRKFVGKRL